MTEKEIEIVMNALSGTPTVTSAEFANKVDEILRDHKTVHINTTNLFNFFHDELKDAFEDMFWMRKFCEISGVSMNEAENCYWYSKDIPNNNESNLKLIDYIRTAGYDHELCVYMSR